MIASINCITTCDWHYFARRIQAAEADALELNVFVLPSNTMKTSAENEKVYFDSKFLLSNSSENSQVLRWIALLSGRVECPLVATTGIHTAEAAIKQLLAGATAFQVVSALYKDGFGAIGKITKPFSVISVKAGTF